MKRVAKPVFFIVALILVVFSGLELEVRRY